MKQILILLFILGYGLPIFSQASSTTLFYALPRSDNEFKNIFNKSPNIDDIKLYGYKPSEALNSHPKIIFEGKSIEELEAIIELQQKTGKGKKYIIIIGHNDNGRFILPNGEGIELKIIEEKLKDIRGIFISCDSEKHILQNNHNIGLNFRLSFKDAFKLSDDIIEIVDKCCMNSLLSDDDIKKKIRDKVNLHKSKQNGRKVLIVGGIGAGGSLAVILLQEESAKEDDTKIEKGKMNKIDKN